MSSWTITNSVPEAVSSRDLEEVMSSFADAIEAAMHRYEPKVRIDAFDLLIERLTEDGKVSSTILFQTTATRAAEPTPGEHGRLNLIVDL